MIPVRCNDCSTVQYEPEINDDPRIEGKFRLDELVQIKGRGETVMYRITKLKGLEMTLEKLL